MLSLNISKLGEINSSFTCYAGADSLSISLEIEMAIRLPDELIDEILSFLPAKSLLRCRSVCKSWLSFINSTKFKFMRLHSFNQLNPRYFVRRWDLFLCGELFWVHFDDETFTEDLSTQIEFPFDKSRVNTCFRIVGCCNGVVCLSDADEFASSLNAIILWNPSIRRKLTLTLPMYSPIEFEDSFVVLGFGYDKMSDDYKVVSLVYDFYTCNKPKVEVYSVKTRIWKEVMFPDNLRCFYVDHSCPQVFSNGFVHWIACDPTPTPGVSHSSILTFDINTEYFGEIQLPEILPNGFPMVSAVGESLAVIYSSNRDWDGLESGSSYIVWVMKEYNNPTSWTMIYGMHYSDIELGKPLRLRNNGDMFVELENRDMIIFKHNVGCYLHVYGDGVEEVFSCKTYVDRHQESLALLDVGDSVPNKEAMEALMKGHGPDAAALHE